MSQSQRGGNGFAAGPPQGETHPLGGQRSSRSGEGGGNSFAAGPPQGETSPLGGQRSTRSGKRGGDILKHGGHHTRLARSAARPV